MRTIGAVTVGRSDFGIYQPILHAIQSDPDLKLHLIVSGSHLSVPSGQTISEIRAAGIEIGQTVEMLLAGDSPEAIAKSMGLGTIAFAQAYSRTKLDILLLLGDRFEMHAAAVAAIPCNLPIAHIHGGEVTYGAFDDSLRHAITKYSHLHFVATPRYAQRVIQLGEQPWRVSVSGAPALDNLQRTRYLSVAQLENLLDMEFGQLPLLVTYHPVTLQSEQTPWQIDELLSVLADIPRPLIFTTANADTCGHAVNQSIVQFVNQHPRARLVDSLGQEAYFSLMKVAAAMIGNSSSGIIEAASLELPVVNVGIRQAGRDRSANVIDVDNDRDSIAAGIQQALQPAFRQSLQNVANVYGRGNASEFIVRRLKSVPLDDSLIIKRFHDLPPTQESVAKQTTAA